MKEESRDDDLSPMHLEDTYWEEIKICTKTNFKLVFDVLLFLPTLNRSKKDGTETSQKGHSR